MIATSGRDRLRVQCKCFGQSVTVQNSAVREVMVAKQRYRAKLGLIVYSGMVSRRTFEFSMAQMIPMWTLDQVVSGSFYDRTVTFKRVPEVDSQPEGDGLLKIAVACPHCKKLNCIPRGRDGVMTCGHCKAQSYQRT